MGRSPLILGISASHNGAVCLLRGDEIIVAIQEERLSRQKRHRLYGSEPSLSIPYCLNTAGVGPSDIDMVVVSIGGRVSNPSQDIRSNPQLKEILRHAPALTIPHHYAHAASAFATSGFSDAVVLVADGMGSPFEDLFDDEQATVNKPVEDGWETISSYYASDVTLNCLEKHLAPRGEWLILDGDQMPRFGSLGGMFSAVAHQVFGNAMDAGKVMGLAPYGNQTFETDQFFDFSGNDFLFHNSVPERFNTPERWPLNADGYKDLCCSVQAALEKAVLHLVARLRERHLSENLCYAGGVALNSVVNELLVQQSGFKHVHIVPAAEDSGPALGAAYYGLWHLTGENTLKRQTVDSCGRKYSAASIDSALTQVRGLRCFPSSDVIYDAVELLSNGMIVGWFDSGSELGPRALGQRSILCDPRRLDGKYVLNSKVKRREAFRPFAPAILLNEAENWFKGDGNLESPFMLRVLQFRDEKAPLVPAVSHVDGTGRVQTLTEQANGRFYELVRKFHERTTVPLLLNTSFNFMGQPIVETPLDALQCLMNTGLDCCVFEDRIVYKSVSW
jgi:carbamoyltransferase